MPTSVSGKRIALEVCVTTADEARLAVASGADRLELCSALEVGGVTPSPGTFLAVRAAVRVAVVVLLRPTPGGFVYTPGEWAAVRRDADWFLAHGADAVVGGALGGPGGLHADRCRELVRAAGGRAVLHRCFDFLPDPSRGLAEAIELGFARVLTSGGARSAPAGSAVIRALVRQSAGRIEVLPGAGIGPGNVAGLVRATGCDQIHASLRSPVPVGEHPVAPAMGTAATTDPVLVAAVRAELDRLAAG